MENRNQRPVITVSSKVYIHLTNYNVSESAQFSIMAYQLPYFSGKIINVLG